MQTFKTDAAALIKKHMDELEVAAEELGGVFITGMDGTVAVIGAKNSKKKVIFQTSFVTENQSKLLDAQIVIQDLLEEDGIEAISEHDFKIAIGEL